jgi:hypothetical protein
MVMFSRTSLTPHCPEARLRLSSTLERCWLGRYQPHDYGIDVTFALRTVLVHTWEQGLLANNGKLHRTRCLLNFYSSKAICC